MNGKKLALGLLAAIVFAIALVVYLGMTGGGTAQAPEARVVTSASATAPPAAYDGGKITQTIVDRRVRDELRRKMLASWASGAGESAEAARGGRFVPAPAHDGAAMDPDYIQSVVRKDMWPMAEACYNELLARNPHAEGKVEMSFKIVGDENLGGIVDDAEAIADGGLGDEKMLTCIRESLSTLAFRPPAHGGVVDIVYPIVFSPGDD